MDNAAVLGKRIKDKRLFLNLRMDDVAQRAGIARTTMWAIEKGKGNCSIDTLMRVLQTLGLSLSISDSESLVSSPNRRRAKRINGAMDKKINRFLIMCVEQYAAFANRPSREVYRDMLSAGTIDELTNDYEDLHGMSTEYLNEYIHSLTKGD